ncbi:MAG: hypothetical protein JSU95_08355 [Betaproteobacteria bacterium]|nr:MAG: hypothetical protein JSU95_08355 [Betaproteobacteria bacterium]
MESDLFFYTTSYLTARLAIVAAFVYGVYRVLRAGQMDAVADGGATRSQVTEAIRKANAVCDDGC